MKTQSKEKPILFSTEMVKAILGGRKTMTRRTQGVEKVNENPDEYYFQSIVYHAIGEITFAPKKPNSNPLNERIIKCKQRYHKDDILWIRETWQWEGNTNLKDIMPIGNFYYRANFEDDLNWNLPFKWKPSIHMPREAARIFLKVTNVRVERLEDISEADAIAEGVEPREHKHFGKGYRSYILDDEEDIAWDFVKKAKDSFIGLWISINEKAFNENPNPWVFVYEFERIEK